LFVRLFEKSGAQAELGAQVLNIDREKKELRYKYRFGVYAIRDDSRIFNNYPDPSADFVSYQYYDREDAYNQRDCEENFQKTIGEFGIANYKTISRSAWNYFPRFTGDGIKKQLPWRLRETQGERNTWHIGGWACFESVNAIVNFNADLAESLKE